MSKERVNDEDGRQTKVQMPMGAVGKSLPVTGIIMCLGMIVLLGLFIGLSAIHVPPDSAFSNDSGFRPGWQIMFWGYGKQLIYGKSEFTTNIALCIAVLAPVILSLILVPMWKNARKTKRIVSSVLLAAAFLAAGAVLLNLCSVALLTASTPLSSSSRPMTELISNYPEEYYPSMLTIVTGAAALLTGVTMAASALLNMKRIDPPEPEEEEEYDDGEMDGLHGKGIQQV